jgi:EmrB/QacA subfamily drug resistance transporter
MSDVAITPGEVVRRVGTSANAVLGVVAVAQFMVVLDASVVNVALPSIQRDVGFSEQSLSWVLNAYTLIFGGFLLLGGRAADRLGRRRLFMAGMALFTAASFACGLSQSEATLLIARGVQGLGGAMVSPAALSIILTTFAEGSERNRALGLWGAIAGAGGAAGLLLGGAIVEVLNWRWVFFVNVPIGALTLALLAVKVGETDRRPVRPDWAGAVTFACSLFALVFGLIRGNADGWTSGTVLSSFIAGGCLLVAFTVIELVRREPMLELGLFRNPTFLGASVAAVALGASLYALVLYITLYLQDILGYSAFQAGLRFLPLTLLVLLAAPVGGRLSAHVPLRLLLSAGLTLAGAGLALMTSVKAGSGWTVLLAGFIVAGAGSGLTNPPRASAAIGSVPEEKAGVGSGVNNTALQVGLAAGIAGLGAVFQSRVHDVLVGQLTVAVPQLGERSHAVVDQATSGNAPAALQSLPPSLRQPVAHVLRVAFVSGFDRILWIAAIIGFAGAVLSLLLVRQRDLEHTGETERGQLQHVAPTRVDVGTSRGSAS